MTAVDELWKRVADGVGPLNEIRLLSVDVSTGPLVLSDDPQSLEAGPAEIGSKFERPEGRDDLARFHLRLGVDLRREGEAKPVFSVLVEYAALYQIPEPLSDGELHAASILIGGPTLWPYARALVGSLTLEMGLMPAITLPALTREDLVRTYEESLEEDAEVTAE